MESEKIIVFTDGSSRGNPGPGGWGAVVADRARVKEIGGYSTHTTNNKMELTAAIEAIKMIRKKAEITIHTDSRYVINGITKWVSGWEKKGWQTLGKTEVQNKELWKALMDVVATHTVVWKHVKGHSGISLNERADVIANGFARKENVELFNGSVAKYKSFVESMPKPRVVSKSKSTSKKTGPAYSYVSVISGKVLTHKTWVECESRVKGKNAKYKKVFSKDEETKLMKEWGV